MLIIWTTNLGKKAIESGYVQGTLPGKSGVYWVKPDSNQYKYLEKANGT